MPGREKEVEEDECRGEKRVSGLLGQNEFVSKVNTFVMNNHYLNNFTDNNGGIQLL